MEIDSGARGTLLTLSVSLPANISDMDAANIAALLEDKAISTSWERRGDGTWSLLWLLDFRPSLPVLRARVLRKWAIELSPGAFELSPVPEGINWLEESYRQFPPFRIGPFFIYGSHFAGDLPAGGLPLLVDAATAFGSGEHGTTKGCLEALIRLKSEGLKPRRILDMGTGSGILGLAAYRLWKKPVLAIDNDPEATKVAARHRRLNVVPAGPLGFCCRTGDGYGARAVRESRGKFDLVIANILAGPLISMAPDLARSLAPRGTAVLSGLLTSQEKDVLAAHKREGLRKKARIVHDEWCTLILE